MAVCFSFMTSGCIYIHVRSKGFKRKLDFVFTVNLQAQILKNCMCCYIYVCVLIKEFHLRCIHDKGYTRNLTTDTQQSIYDLANLSSVWFQMVKCQFALRKIVIIFANLFFANPSQLIHIIIVYRRKTCFKFLFPSVQHLHIRMYVYALNIHSQLQILYSSYTIQLRNDIVMYVAIASQLAMGLPKS